MPEAERSSSRRTADKAGSQLRKLVRTPSAFPAPGLPKPFARQMRLQAMPPRSADAASRRRARDAGLKTTAAQGPAKGISAMTARAGADAEAAGADSSARSACRTALSSACRLGGVPSWRARRDGRMPLADAPNKAASSAACREAAASRVAACAPARGQGLARRLPAQEGLRPKGSKGSKSPRTPVFPFAINASSGIYILAKFT